MKETLTYLAPANLDSLFQLMADYPQATIMAGGTDLLVEARKHGLPSYLLDIKNLKELNYIKIEAGYLAIGAATNINAIKESPEIEIWCPALRKAAEAFGCYEIRNRATLGGNVMRASPGAEFAPLLWVYEAKVRLLASSGFREMAILDFITAAGKTKRMPNEILEAVLLPLYDPKNSLQGYRRIARVAGMDLASLNAAVLILNAFDPEARQMRIAFGAVAPLPDRPTEVEALLAGKKITRELLAKAKVMLYEHYQPRATSLRATPEYKKIMTGNLLEMMLEEMGMIS
jgi:CO/xanthine dehydrogenase FAD-binding subunit